MSTDPRLQPSISVAEYEKKKIIVISVSSRIGVPISVRGRYFRRAGRTNQRMSHEVHGTLNNQLDGALSWFRERLETEFIFKGEAEREVRWEYPLNAIREAVVNVLCHRDYSSLAHSQIRLYDDHLVIWNAGGLPPALTPEILFQEHDSVPRNRKIADVFFYSGLMNDGAVARYASLKSFRQRNYRHHSLNPSRINFG